MEVSRFYVSVQRPPRGQHYRVGPSFYADVLANMNFIACTHSNPSLPFPVIFVVQRQTAARSARQNSHLIALRPPIFVCID